MSENGLSRRSSGFDEAAAQIQTHQKKQDEETQLERIWTELENSEEGAEIDPERFLRDMAVLDELVPLPDFDLSASWQEFRENHHELLEGLDPADQQSSAFASEEKPKRRRSRKSIRVAVVVVLLLAALAMASCGIIERILQAIADWSEEVFHYEVTQELRTEVPEPELPETEHYESLEEALEEYGIPTEYARIHYPEGYCFHEARVSEVANAIKIVASYIRDDEEIVFTIWHYKDSTSLELNAAEKLPPDAEIYIQNGNEYYILVNSETTTITWISGFEMYMVWGKLSVEEVNQMIDSLN